MWLFTPRRLKPPPSPVYRVLLLEYDDFSSPGLGFASVDGVRGDD